MRRLLFLASALTLAAGCVTQPRYSMGYYSTDDGLDGCAFRYSYYPYYDAGAGSAARMNVDRLTRIAVPRTIDDRGPGLLFHGSLQPPPGADSAGASPGAVTVVDNRSAILPASPAPAAPRVVGPRS
jgi:hypothetical protein